jgi:TRAP-type C4-dicarboxylate transport system permease small subunit
VHPQQNTSAGLSGPARFGHARRLIDIWALAGGLVLLAVVAMQVASVIGGVVWRPFPGDYEMTEVGVVVAVFSFLPHCQLHRANVSADIFTMRAPPFLIGIFGLLASAVALGFALLLGWRMYYGMLDQKAYNYETTILQFPTWIGFLPILISLALLALASLITLAEDFGTLKKA